MVCRSIPALIAVTLWLTPISAGAKVPELTGAEYLSRCTSKDRNWKPRNQDEQDDAVYCLGYIEGAVTLIILWDGQAYCLPPRATRQDMIRATFEFMQDHPEQKQYLFASVMVAAARAQWPCRSK